MSKKITIEQVLKRKKLLGEINIYHSSLFDADIEIEKIKPETVISVMNKENTDEIEQYKELIYHSCPFFRQKELHEKFNIKNPIDAVSECFGDNYCEILELGNLILRRYGFTAEKVEKVKKQ